LTSCPRRSDACGIFTRTVLVDETQTYRIEAPLDGIARRVEALLVAGQPGGSTRTTRLRFETDEPGAGQSP
jgi:hypothetical protein